MAFGDYPAEYNPKIHGVYDPARFYGKREYKFDDNFTGRTEFFDKLLLHEFRYATYGRARIYRYSELFHVKKLRKPVTMTFDSIPFFFCSWHPLEPGQSRRSRCLVSSSRQEPKSHCWSFLPRLLEMATQVRPTQARWHCSILPGYCGFNGFLLHHQLRKDQWVPRRFCYNNNLTILFWLSELHRNYKYH